MSISEIKRDIREFEITHGRSNDLRRELNMLIGGSGKRGRDESSSSASVKRQRPTEPNCFDLRSTECDQALKDAALQYFKSQFATDFYFEGIQKSERRDDKRNKIKDGKLLFTQSLRLKNERQRYECANYLESDGKSTRPYIFYHKGHAYSMVHEKPNNYWSDGDKWYTFIVAIKPATQDDVTKFNEAKKQRFLKLMSDERKKFQERLEWVNHITDHFVEDDRDAFVKNMRYEVENAVFIYNTLFNEMSKYNAFVLKHKTEYSDLRTLNLIRHVRNLRNQKKKKKKVAKNG